MRKELVPLKSFAVNYEGQAAITLEATADKNERQHYVFDIAENGAITSETIIRRIVEDLLNGESVAKISARFHLAIAELIATIAVNARDQQGINRVALSAVFFRICSCWKARVRIWRNAGLKC